VEENENYLEEEVGNILVPANPIKRLTNYLIDIILFYILLSVLISIFFPGFIEIIKNQKQVSLSNEIILQFFYGLYMSLIETIFKGKSPAKFLTGTRVVYYNGGAISSETAFIRGLCRLIPFEQISAIGFPPNPWHDRWPRTLVIDENLSSIIKKN
jgi:uncharacterized RDD family membrane protein YckC